MKNCSGKIIMVTTIVVFGCLGTVFTEEVGSLQDGYLSAPVQAFITRQDALKNEDYEKAWEMTTKSIQEQYFGGNLENFKMSLSNPEIRAGINKSEIEEVKNITPKETKIKVSRCITNWIRIVEEDGVFKVAGEEEVVADR